MKPGFITLLLIIINSFLSLGKGNTDSIPTIELTTISRANQGNSYFTFPTDIGNLEPLWFEGNLIPNFHIRSSKDSRLMGVLTPQIIIRMYQKESAPVRTPSYMPQLSIYYLLSSKKKANSFSIFGRLAHHSNGQEGAFYLENGDINLMTGSFSTNYYEIGLIKTNYSKKLNAVQFISSSVEIHPENLTIDELHGIYSLYRRNTIFSIFKLPSDKNNVNFSIKGKSTWMFGNINQWKDFSLDRLNLSLSIFYHPKFLEDIGLFAQIYHGMDYYNIYFDHKISVIRFGIMTEKLRF